MKHTGQERQDGGTDVSGDSICPKLPPYEKPICIRLSASATASNNSNAPVANYNDSAPGSS